ncbi:hypothetical protein WR25_26359 [Diploscapter pachys]|uniref:Uncharacterized protein n=1 Tax=Diploscapter pachys TaxID=2018661 RepID=A0A2A2JJH7_9BILA|nr:hypothetical protein WR25_26359 [Diploscapter pachys]
MDTQSRSAAAAIEEGMWKGNRGRGGTMWLKRHTLPAGWLVEWQEQYRFDSKTRTQTVNSRRQLKSSNTYVSDRTTVLAFVIIEQHNVRIDVKGEERRGENRRSTEAPVTAAAAAVLTTPTSTELQGQRKGKGVKRPAADEKTHNNDAEKWGGVRRGTTAD